MKIRKIQQEYFLVITIINDARDDQLIDALARLSENDPRAVLLEVRRNTRRGQTSIVAALHLEGVQKYVERFIKQARTLLADRPLPSDLPGPGWLDSIAIVPLLVSNLPMATLMVNDLATILANRYDIPIYFFGKNATQPRRASLQYYRQWTVADFSRREDLQPDVGQGKITASPIGGLAMGSRLYYLTFALYLDSEELPMVQEFLKAYTDFSGLTDEERELKNHALQKLKMQKIHILQNVQTIADLWTEMDMLRIFCKIRDYQQAPLYQVYDLFDKAFKRLGVELLGMQIFGFIPMEVLVLSGRHYFKGKSLRLMDDLRFLTFALNHFRVDVVEPFDKDMQIIEFRINHLLSNR